LSDNRGFTITEVVVAIVIFSVGVLGLAGTAASVTRMVGRGQQSNRAAALASARFETLKAQTLVGTNCGGIVSGSTTEGRYSLAWTVTTVGTGRQVTITVTSPTATGARTDTFTSWITCLR
jgi:prepilin-type N-terminal cleavage/methylation domain-containing protein